MSNRRATQDQILLLEQIAALVAAGVSLEAGLQTTAVSGNKRVDRMARQIAKELEAGESFELALQHVMTLGPAEAAVLNAGFAAGRPGEAIEALVDYSRFIQNVRHRMSVMLIYPLMITVTAYVLVCGMIALPLPAMLETMRVFRLEPPLAWNVLEWLNQYRLVWMPGLPLLTLFVWLLGGSLIRRIFRSGERLPVAPWQWLPGVGQIYRYAAEMEYCRLLELLVTRNVPWGQAVRLAGEAALDVRLRRGSRSLAILAEQGGAPAEDSVDLKDWPESLRFAVLSARQDGLLVPLLQQVRSLIGLQLERQVGWVRTVLPMLLLIGVTGSITFVYSLLLFVPLKNLFEQLTIPPI